ncbi:MAG: gliding motility-associated C-terminal domain-containing protein [Bacteroidales bacterium]|nr:gliding motility-associated C-terminal domain-containing protein [Bacteroidales bacterium]
MKKYLTIILLFIRLFAKPQVNVSFSVDSNIVCTGYPVKFYDNSYGDTIVKWLWDFGDGTTDTVKNPIHIYSAAGKYNVTLKVWNQSNFFILTKFNFIIVRDTPDADFFCTDTLFLPSYMVFCKAEINNRDGGKYWYFWKFDNDGYKQNDSLLTYLFDSDGEHTISLIVKAGAGCYDTVEKKIELTDLIEAPNIFTPNNDGLNDIFYVKTNGYNEFVIEIFNRWGELIYSKVGRRIEWDGYSSAGVKMPAGIYYYHITSSEVKGYNKSGKILLIR